MQKILDKNLEKAVAGIIEEHDKSEDAAAEIVAFLKKTQDAGGMKVCQVITKEAA